MRKGKIDPYHDYEGSHDPELTGAEDKALFDGLTRRQHFDDALDKAWWGDNPFAGIPNSDDKDNSPF